MADLPGSYHPDRVGTLFYPDFETIASQAFDAKLSPVAAHGSRIYLLIIDMQVDFCHPRGALYVPGAEDDIRRLIEFIYRNAERIAHITCSLDSHQAHQIFHPVWWVDQQGQHPPPFTVITPETVEEGRWRPLQQPEWSLEYLSKLRTTARRDLIIWPYHVPIGGVGNALDPELFSAVFWHSVARQTSPTWWRKGDRPETEHYSILRPEVSISGQPAQAPLPLLEEIQGDDLLFIAGEAASHCVAETVADLVEIWKDRPRRLDRTYLLGDCTSPVQHPEIDFPALAREAFAGFQARGIHLVKSIDSVPVHE